MLVGGYPIYTMGPTQGHGVAGDADGVVALETPQRDFL
jgi:hypothetical protein